LHARVKLGHHVSVARDTPSPDVKIPAARASSVHTFPATSLLQESVPSHRQIHPSQPQFMRGAATGIIISIFTLMTFVYVQNFHPEIINSLIRFGKNLSGNDSAAVSVARRGARAASKPSSGRPPGHQQSRMRRHLLKKLFENSALLPKVEPLPKSSSLRYQPCNRTDETLRQPVHHGSAYGKQHRNIGTTLERGSARRHGGRG